MSFADDVIDGIYCQRCGDYLGDVAGFPTTCAGCRMTELADAEPEMEGTDAAE